MEGLPFTVGVASRGKPRRKLEVTVVPDDSIACPGCGAYWGHPDPALDFPNRFKVDDFCRCYNPACNIGYYNPYTGETEEELSPDEAKKITDMVTAQFQHGHWEGDATTTGARWVPDEPKE